LLESLRREGAAWAEEELLAFAAELGGSQVLEWGRLANEHPPVLHGSDHVEFHPAWHSLLALGIRAGLQRPGSQVARSAKFMALTQVEAGVGCPLSMTHAALPTLRFEPALATEWEPRVVAGEALIGMGMTEKQGGSDVRANETEARPAGDGVATLHGHKWFCSAPMSDAFLMLAQAPGGLSCYLVPREANGIVIERLKDKLGNRSNASSEIRLEGARGRLVGGEGRGIATIIEMVVNTRLDCVVGSAALMREAVAQATHHCAHRVAFGKLLVDQPLMQNVLADLCVESEAATISALRLARAFDEGDEFRRVGTAVL
jgi:putative acyl-CoA dehydrogenase